MRFLLLLALFSVNGAGAVSAEVWSSMHRLTSPIAAQHQTGVRKPQLIDSHQFDDIWAENYEERPVGPRRRGTIADQLVEPATPEDVDHFARFGIPLVEGVPPFAVLFPPNAGRQEKHGF